MLRDVEMPRSRALALGLGPHVSHSLFGHLRECDVHC